MKITKPFFSIITCTLNSEKYICKNLNSVKAQTFKDFEQIIIDGESSDDTGKIVKRFTEFNPKIKLFSYPPKGISNAFNLGIKHSHGKYILFLNSDDHLYDENVLRDIKLFLAKNPDLDWIYGKINVTEENGKSIGVFPRWKIFQISSKYLLKFVNFIPHQAVFIKKDIFDKFGNFDTFLKTNMDVDLWLRIASNTKWIFFDRLISNYMIRKGSGSSDRAKKYTNLKDLQTVQSRYLSPLGISAAKIINWLIMNVNTTYR